MRERATFCQSQDIIDRGERLINSSKLSLLVSQLKREGRDELSNEEIELLASFTLCPELREGLEELATLLSNEDITPPPAGNGLVIANTTLSDEGHGWVVLNNRLSNGKQAIIHTGHKFKKILRYDEGLVAKREANITSRTTQQPFALRKTLKRRSSEKSSSGRTEYQTCTKVVYRNVCEYDPDTNRGRCERVPFTVEGTREVTKTPVKDTHVNEFEFLSTDSSRVLAVLKLETTSESIDYDWGDCETDPIYDDPDLSQGD